jgi:hypothetical protein
LPALAGEVSCYVFECGSLLDGDEAMLNKLWSFLKAEENQKLLGWIGGGLGWGLIQIHAIIMAARARPER